jgi:carbon-monoxide dehydrogenase medium subunit
MSVPAPFDYHVAQSVDEAIALLQQYGDEAKVLAGGHSLIPAMKLRLSQPGHLIDIGRVQGLSYIREDNGAVAVGALTTYTQIAKSDVLRSHFAVVSECAHQIADQQVRNRGTIGGSLAHSDPASDMPGVVMALRGEIVVQGPNGRRTISADDFLIGTFTTALAADEILLEIRFAIPQGRSGSAYEKLANRASHYAVAGCAAYVVLDNDGTCSSAGVAITGAAMQTVRASAVEAALINKRLDEATIAEAASHAAEGLEIVSDIHGSVDYRRQMVEVITRRTIAQAAERA